MVDDISHGFGCGLYPSARDWRTGMSCSWLIVRMMKAKATRLLMIAVMASLFSSSRAAAQTAATTKPAPADSAAGDRRPNAKQVVTVLHRLNGLKMLRLLLRSGQSFGSVET